MLKRSLGALFAILALTVSGARAELVEQRVSYSQDGTQLQGYLVYDDAGAGKRPGMLVVHEWWGLNEYVRERARQLAKAGYVALAVDMYGGGRSTDHPAQAREWSQQVRQTQGLMVARARAGLQALRQQPQVDPQRIGAIGFCFGGTTVLQLAYSGADLDGVASFHGGLPVPSPSEQEQIAASLLILHGSQDPLAEPGAVPRLQQALDAAAADWHMVIYGGAKHGFTNPQADSHGIEALAYDPEAAARSWQHMLRFFDQRFTR